MRQFTHSILVLLTASAVAVFAYPVHPDKYASITNLKKRNTNTGHATALDPGFEFGACGSDNSDTDFVVAISPSLFGAGENCDMWVQITSTSTGAIGFGIIVDECEECGDSDLNISPTLFQQFAPLADGEFDISWEIEPAGFNPSRSLSLGDAYRS